MTSTSEDIRAGRPAPTIDLHGESTNPVRLLASIWASRDLLVILARKDFFTRYRRASLGVLWAVVMPLLQTAVLVVMFRRLLNVTTSHYPIYVLSGMLVWTYFSGTFAAAATSIVDASAMSSRVYFPRALLPITPAISNGYGYLIGLAILMIACPLFGAPMGLGLLYLVPGTALMIILTVGFSLVFAALHVYFRDIRYVVSAALLVWFYVSPIIYPVSSLPHIMRVAVSINPVTGIIDLFQAATLGSAHGLGLGVFITCAWSLGLLLVALVLNARYDRVFADLL